MAELLKNKYYQKLFFEKLTSKIKEETPTFQEEKFFELLYDAEWENRELKARMRHATLSLQQTFNKEYLAVLPILEKTAHHFNDLDALIFPDYVEVFGQDFPKKSLAALEYFTRFSTAEFAIRPFLIKDSKATLKYFYSWTENENEHVRRLASEGCRPRLPWGMALPEFKKNPVPILPILEKLKADDSEYVRRSVANNLNDIAKDNPETVIKIAQNWYGDNSKTDWIVKHACRTLLKQGRAEVLKIFGFGDADLVEVKDLKLSKNQVKIGEGLTFSFGIQSIENQKLRLEYIVEYVKANGKTSPKVFQITEREFQAKQWETFEKKISFENLTTRKHYAGEHKLILRVNGINKSETLIILEK